MAMEEFWTLSRVERMCRRKQMRYVDDDGDDDVEYDNVQWLNA